MAFPQAPDLEAWLRFSSAAATKIAALHRERPLDIVQASNSRACGLFTMLRTPLPVVTRISCYRPLWNAACRIPASPDVQGVEAAELVQLKLCRRIISPSRELARVLARDAGVPEVEIIPTPAYVEVEREDDSLYAQYLAGRRYVAYAGRFQKHKGFDVLVRALQDTLADFPEVHAVFVGMDTPDEYGVSMKKQAEDALSPHAGRVHFFGQTGHDRLYPVMRRAALVVLPSLVDNIPNTCLEAMMLGRPVVGTSGASFDELIRHGENGFLVPPGDAPRLAQTMGEALGCDRLEAIGEAARASVRRLAGHPVAKAHEDYYQRVLRAGSRRA
jgi:glycosyltransferase involved in cell wall biosynthesis